MGLISLFYERCEKGSKVYSGHPLLLAVERVQFRHTHTHTLTHTHTHPPQLRDLPCYRNREASCLRMHTLFDLFFMTKKSRSSSWNVHFPCASEVASGYRCVCVLFLEMHTVARTGPATNTCTHPTRDLFALFSFIHLLCSLCFCLVIIAFCCFCCHSSPICSFFLFIHVHISAILN